jgi:hypothetical protein
MIYGKITPTAKVVKQETPFTSTTVEAHYMGAVARPYSLGASKVDFEVIFGNLVTKTNSKGESIQQFERVIFTSAILTAAELADWGTDDTHALSAIATKLEIEVSDFITLEDDDRQF